MFSHSKQHELCLDKPKELRMLSSHSKHELCLDKPKALRMLSSHSKQHEWCLDKPKAPRCCLHIANTRKSYCLHKPKSIWKVLTNYNNFQDIKNMCVCVCM